VCLTAGAADMNNYCPVNSRTQIAGQFPGKAYMYLSIYTSCESAKAQAGFWAGQQVSEDQLCMSVVRGVIKT